MIRLRHLLEYHSLAGFAVLVRLMPLAWNRWVARRLADLVFYCIPVRKNVVLKNLSDSFGDSKTHGELFRLARNTYRQFAETMIELLYFPKLDRARIRELVALENTALLDLANRMGKGAVLVGAHFGNWELMAAALALHYPVTLVVGQQENGKVDDLLNSYRLAKGLKIIPLKLALRGVMKALKNNEFVALLSDQDAHEDGAFVDFFGRPASTPRGAALFALRAGCPLITGHIFREKGAFRVVFETVPRPEPSGDESRDVERYTAAYVKILEGHCRSHPDHWFWMHRRWKTKPPARPGGAIEKMSDVR